MARQKKEPITEKKARKPIAKGVKSRGARKLTDNQVLDIVARYNGGKGDKMSAIAKAFGVTHPTISSIVKGKTYVWLTGIGKEPAEQQMAA